MSILLYSTQNCCIFYKISTCIISQREKGAFKVIVKLCKCISVSCSRKHYQDESKDILNSILKEEVLSDSDPEESIERASDILHGCGTAKFR